MLEEVHVKLCRITKLDWGPEIDVADLRNEHVLQRAREQEKVPAGAGRFCLRALRTKLSRMFLLHLKVMRVIGENGWRLRVIFKNLKITTTNDVPNFVVKGMKCQNYKGILSSEILAKGGFRVSQRELLKAFWIAESHNLCHRCMDCLVWITPR